MTWLLIKVELKIHQKNNFLTQFIITELIKYFSINKKLKVRSKIYLTPQRQYKRNNYRN